MPNVDKEMLASQKAAIAKALMEKQSSFLLPIDEPQPGPISHPSPVLKGRNVGCVVMAGGLSTRLGNSIPKGVIPFSPVAGKPLLQILAEKVRAYNQCYGTEAHFAVMTSEETDGPTKALFESHDFFGLSHVEFFSQKSLPLLDMEENLIIEEGGTILKGPDGNGRVFSGLKESGIADQWRKDGVDAISLVIIDNPLIDPFCPGLFAPVFEGADLTAAAIERKGEEEKVGVFAKKEGRTTVVEYSEIDPTLASQRDEKGHLLFRWANISCFCCTIPFISAAAALSLPLHAAKKVVKGRQVWKSEYFVFDAMVAAQKIQILPLHRTDFFAPVKDKLSFEEARLAMMARDRRRYFELTGEETEKKAPFELTASAYYPTPHFLEWLEECGIRQGLVEEPS